MRCRPLVQDRRLRRLPLSRSDASMPSAARRPPATRKYARPDKRDAADLTISDDGRWNSIRLGLAGEITLPAGFWVRAEAAWLPYMNFSGDNDHWLREPDDFSGASRKPAPDRTAISLRRKQLCGLEQFRHRHWRSFLVDERQGPCAVSGRHVRRRLSGRNLSHRTRSGLRAIVLSFLITDCRRPSTRGAERSGHPIAEMRCSKRNPATLVNVSLSGGSRPGPPSAE